MFFDSYELHIKDFKDIHGLRHHFPVLTFEISTFQNFKLSKFQISSFKISIFQSFEISNFQVSKSPIFKYQIIKKSNGRFSQFKVHFSKFQHVKISNSKLSKKSIHRLSKIFQKYHYQLYKNNISKMFTDVLSFFEVFRYI